MSVAVGVAMRKARMSSIVRIPSVLNDGATDVGVLNVDTSFMLDLGTGRWWWCKSGKSSHDHFACEVVRKPRHMLDAG